MIYVSYDEAVATMKKALLRYLPEEKAHHFAERHDLAKPLAPPKAHIFTKSDIAQTPR